MFSPENRVVYEIMWKNVVQPDRPKMTIIKCMQFVCWITNATDTHSKYVTIFAFPRQQWIGERFSMSRYTYIARLE